jgi:hypothetical protein
MSNDVMFNFGVNDRASGSIKKIKREADSAQGSLGKYVKSMSIGGEHFNRTGERLRKFSELSGGFMALGGAAVVAGLGINAMMIASDNAVESARTQVQWQQRLRNEIKSTADFARQFKAGGIGQASHLGKLIGSGGDLAQVKKNVGLGIEHTDSVKGESALALIGDYYRRNEIRRAAQDVARLHETSFTDAVNQIKDMRGPISSQRALINVRGQRSNANTIAMARDSLGKLSIYTGDKRLENINKAIANGSVQKQDQAEYLMSGETGRAIDDMNGEARDKYREPSQAAMKNVIESAEEVREGLLKAVNAQWRLAKFFKDMTYYFGSGGSELTKLRNHSRDTKVVSD